MTTNEERRCYETVDEMGLEAVLALKRERDELRARVAELELQLRIEREALRTYGLKPSSRQYSPFES